MRRTYLLIGALTAMNAVHIHAAPVDFVKDIEPILQESCVKCHQPSKHKGDLLLDSKAGAFKGGQDGLVLAPGHSDKSDLYRRVILAPDSDDFMPSKGTALTKAQTDLIKQWIDEGANWPDDAILKTTAATAEVAEPMPKTGVEMLTAFKPTPEEDAAIAKIARDGFAVRLVSVSGTWREASFRGRGSRVTDATIAPLKDVMSLVELNLARTKITDAGLPSIAGLTNLLTLHLEHTAITDAGLASLANLPHLAYLNLFDTQVSDAGLAQLKGLKNLQHLYLWQTKVTAQGEADLQKALPKLKISRGWENDPAAIEAKAKAAAEAKTAAEIKSKDDDKSDAKK